MPGTYSYSYFLRRLTIPVLMMMLLAVVDRPAQSQNNLDSLFDSFSSASTETKKVWITKIFDRLDDRDTAYAKEQSERLVKLTAALDDKWFYIKALIYYSNFGNRDSRLKILDEAYQLAAENNEDELMGFAQVNKSMIFKDNMQYDSAMVSILKARGHFESAKNTNELVTVMHVIGDLYFYSSLSDKAEEMYKKVLELKGEPVAWRDWRRVVVTNNLGLVEERRGNYDKAANYFHNSLNYVLSYKDSRLNRHDSIRLGYVYQKLAEIYSFQRESTQTAYYYAKALPLVSKYGQTGWKVNLLLTQGRLHNFFSHYDTALDYLQKALELNKKEFHSPAAAAEISKELSYAFGKKGDFKNAWLAKSEYIRLSDSLDAVVQQSKDMEILAEDNYKAYVTEIKTYEREKVLLVSVITILSLSLMVILFVFIRLKTSDRRLVEKNLELVRSEEYHRGLLRQASGEKEPEEGAQATSGVEGVTEAVDESAAQKRGEVDRPESEDGESEISLVQLRSLVSRLEDLMATSRLYLNPDLTLEELAEKLNTNRTYLSRAINKVFDNNYTSYVNALRIKEAVRIISNKEFELYKIEGIAKTAGFKNRTSFIAAFRKYTGVTPSFFIRNLQAK